MSVGTMLREGLERHGAPPKAVAAEINYSIDAVYAAMNNKRRIPKDAGPKLAGMHPMAGLAVALEATGYNKLFSIIEGDRHPQTMIRRVEKEDFEADEALKPVSWIIIDKNRPEDLTPEEVVMMKAAVKEICDRVINELNLVIELDDRYRLGLMDVIRTKEKAPQKRSY